MIQLAKYWSEQEGIQSRTKILKGYLQDFNFPNSTFDAITCIAVLHYLDHSERLNILQQVKKLLKPNGLFVWTVGVKPETEEELDYLKKLYKKFSEQNGVENSVVDKIIEALDTEYKMITAKEELEMLKSIGFQYPIEIFSTLFFKTYIVKNTLIVQSNTIDTRIKYG